MAAWEEKKRGCIKETKGPWIVRRKGRDGAVVSTSWRSPTDHEREKNRLREQRRRRVAAKIYAGLREHGNYCLPKHADHNDILRALCEEAGWRVDDEGNISRKDFLDGSNIGTMNSELVNFDYNYPPSNYHEEMRVKINEDELSLNLTLAFKYM